MNNECFALGRLMATRGVADKMNDCPEFERFARQAFARYRRCDWGDLTESDKRQNDEAVRNNDDRILAASSPNGTEAPLRCCFRTSTDGGAP